MLTLEPRLPSSFAFEGGALAAGAAGLAGGWLLIVWVQHRYRRRGPTQRKLIKRLGLLPVWVIGPATLVGLALAAPDVTSWSVLSAAAALRMFGVYGAAVIALGLAVSAALAVLLAALPMPAAGPTAGRGPLPVSLTP